MPLQNRVTPLGELIAHPGRGLVYGNRGCLHDANGRIRRRYAGKRWIACQLEFRGWTRGPLLQPGRFTELFFLDEATAFAAGHRPCALCRREDYDRFATLWRELHPCQTGADAIDAQLHRERIAPGTRAQLHQMASLDDVPDGTFVLEDDAAFLVRGDQLFRWTARGYVEPRPRPRGQEAVVITPPSLVSVLRTSWRRFSCPSCTHPLTSFDPDSSSATVASMHLLFLDESGQLSEHKFFALGGIAIRDSDWHSLRDLWQTTLAAHGWPQDREIKWHGIRKGEVPPPLADAIAPLARS